MYFRIIMTNDGIQSEHTFEITKEIAGVLTWQGTLSSTVALLAKGVMFDKVVDHWMDDDLAGGHHRFDYTVEYRLSSSDVWQRF